MWRAFNTDGTLTYSFVESLQASYPGYYVRLLGGFIFFAGMLVMAYNIWRTIASKEESPLEPLPVSPSLRGKGQLEEVRA